MRISTGEYLSEVLERIMPIGEISVKRALGGNSLYRRGVIFGLVVFDELYFKVGEKNRPHYLAYGCSPLIFPGKQPPWSLGYRRVPPHVLADKKILEEWVLAACEASAEIPMPKKRRARFKTLVDALLGRNDDAKRA